VKKGDSEQSEYSDRGVPNGEVPELLLLPLPPLWLYGGSSIDKPILFIGKKVIVIDEELNAKSKKECKRLNFGVGTVLPRQFPI